MGYLTDIEIAQQCEMKPITEIAKTAGVDDKYIEQYGNYKAKIDLSILNELDRKDGKLILVFYALRARKNNQIQKNQQFVVAELAINAEVI